MKKSIHQSVTFSGGSVIVYNHTMRMITMMPMNSMMRMTAVIITDRSAYPGENGQHWQ